MIAKALQRLAVPVGDLSPHPRNARQGDVGAISQSLERFGQVRPIVVQKSTGYVVAGNHVLAAAKSLGWPKVARVAVDMTDQEAIAYLVADNRLADLGSYDEQAVADLLAELAEFSEGLEGTGYDGDDLDDLLRGLKMDNLDDLSRRHGQPEESDFWPVVRVKLNPIAFELWVATVKARGRTEAEVLEELLAGVSREPGEA